MVAQKVTDLTSLGVLAYDMVVDEQVRKDLWQQLLVIKEQIGEDPKQFFPIVIDIASVLTTGNTSDEWVNALNKQTDKGKRNHLLTRGAGNIVITAGTTIFSLSTNIGDFAQKLGVNIEDVRWLGKYDWFLVKRYIQDIEKVSGRSI